MFQAERDQSNTVRAIQAAQRDNCAHNRDWLLRAPLLVIDHPDEILEQEPEDGVIVDVPEEEVAQQELILVPEEELEENLVGAENDDILDFDLDDDQQEIPMDQQALANVLLELQNGMEALRNEHAHIGNGNHAHVANVENQVRTLERERQNNLPRLLPMVVPNSLLKVFTGDDISETWQDWLDNFLLAARACGWDEQKRLHVLPAYLDGTTREAYSTLGLPVQNNWDNLTNALAQRLQQPDSVQTAVNVLLMMRQQLNEPVSMFATKILKLVQKAYLAPAFTDAQRNEIAKNHFLKGMLPTIADSFTAVDPAITFENALVRARRVEARKKSSYAS